MAVSSCLLRPLALLACWVLCFTSHDVACSDEACQDDDTEILLQKAMSVKFGSGLYTLNDVTCEDVKDVDAGGHSCGSRINWLVQTQHMSRPDAEDKVAGEFPQECGACAKPGEHASNEHIFPKAPKEPPKECKDVKDVMAGGHSCGSRINWLVQTLHMAQSDAEDKVAGEFPQECGVCATIRTTSKPPAKAETTKAPGTATSCEDVRDAMAGDYSCGSRIDWLVNSQGKARTDAENSVASEFPKECGACGNLPPEKHKEEKQAPKVPLTGKLQIEGRKLLVNGDAIHIKGVNWNPVGKGKSHPWGLEWNEQVDQDSDLMQEAGINLVRPYVTITDTAVLDKLWSKGIYVANTVYGWGCDPAQSAVDNVEKVKSHPAILMWVIGNEWNYNNLYGCLTSADEAEARLTEVAKRIKEVDTDHPISTIYGEVPSKAIVNRMANVDIWGINAYRGLTLGSLFDQWKSVSGLPMYLGEYGADAWNANTGAEDEAAQAKATKVLTEEIVSHSAKTGGDCLGGVIFEFNDEWWKDHAGPWDVQDVGGVAPGGGPYPDSTFNEEWWGLVTIDRVPREAYTAYKNVQSP